MGKPLVVRVGDLLREPGSSRPLDIELEAERLETTAASTIPGTPLTVGGTVMAMSNGVEVIGTIGFDWYGACRRCLDDVTGHVDVALREIAQRTPIDDEIYPIDGDLLIGMGSAADPTTGERLKELRRELNGLVAAWHHRTSSPHGVIHADLRTACGGPPTAVASADDLERRIQTIRSWAVHRRS